MRREFVEDGWRFRVRERNLHGEPPEVIVQFYDDTLYRPEVDDVFRVEEEATKEVDYEHEHRLFGYTLWTSEKTKTVRRDIDETVEIAMERAWEKIEQIDQSPSEQFNEAVTGARDD